LISEFRLRIAARHLGRGGIIAYPTEGVFGLGCDPFNPLAAARLLALKGRTLAKGFILIAADFGQIEPFLAISEPAMQARMLATWPGPVTWIAPARDGVPAWLKGEHSGIAVRVTAHPVASALCRAFGGPIVSTSANRSGGRPARSVLQARKYFAAKGGLLFIPGRVGNLRQPTPIYDAQSGVRYR
jgi:L-threonylcarbamoyladenylate synthase